MQGIWSVHAEVGVSQPYFEEGLVKREMIESTDRVVALASAEKIGTASTFVVAPASAYIHLATERGVPDGILDPFRKIGVEIVMG